MTDHNPTDINNLGSKIHILTDKDDIPLSIFKTSENTQDITVVINTIDNIVIERPLPSKSKHKQNLYLVKAFNSIKVEEEMLCVLKE